MKLLARIAGSKPAHRPPADKRNGGGVSAIPSAPPRVQRGSPPTKSLFERALVKVTPQKFIDRERRAQRRAFFDASRVRYQAVQHAVRTANGAMASLLDAVKAGDTNGITNASTQFHEALEPFSREFRLRQSDTPEDVLDAFQLRSACIRRAVQAWCNSDSTGSPDLARLQALHESLEQLPKNAQSHPLLTHLALTVKAELLHHAMGRVTLDRVRQEPDDKLRTKGLQELTTMGKFAKDIGDWMLSNTFVLKDQTGKPTPRYGDSIPGSSLTRPQLDAFGPQAEVAGALLKAGEISAQDLSKISLKDLRHFREDIARFAQRPHPQASDRALYKALHGRLCAAITQRQKQLAAANRSTGQPFSAFKQSLHAVLCADEKGLPTALLAHAGHTEKAVASIENGGTRLSSKQRRHWINKALKSADARDLKRLQASLHYGDGKWLIHDLSINGTLRAMEAREHLSMLKEVLDARLLDAGSPIPLPPARPMLRPERPSPAVAAAFQAHPYPWDAATGSVRPGEVKPVLAISPSMVAALQSINHLHASPQALSGLQGVHFGRLVEALAQAPGQLELLDVALDKLRHNGKPQDPLLAPLALAAKAWLLFEARAQTASSKAAQKEGKSDAQAGSEGFDALMQRGDLARQIVQLKREVGASDTALQAQGNGVGSAQQPLGNEAVFPRIPLTMKALQSTLDSAEAARRQRQRIDAAKRLAESVDVGTLSNVPRSELLHLASELTWLLDNDAGTQKEVRTTLAWIEQELESHQWRQSIDQSFDGM